MEKLNNAINLLSAVVSTMDTIAVVGLGNQDKFVGCANAVRTAEKYIRDYVAAASCETDEKQEVDDG